MRESRRRQPGSVRGPEAPVSPYDWLGRSVAVPGWLRLVPDLLIPDSSPRDSAGSVVDRYTVSTRRASLVSQPINYARRLALVVESSDDAIITKDLNSII